VSLNAGNGILGADPDAGWTGGRTRGNLLSAPARAAPESSSCPFFACSVATRPSLALLRVTFLNCARTWGVDHETSSVTTHYMPPRRRLSLVPNSLKTLSGTGRSVTNSVVARDVASLRRRSPRPTSCSFCIPLASDPSAASQLVASRRARPVHGRRERGLLLLVQSPSPLNPR